MDDIDAEVSFVFICYEGVECSSEIEITLEDPPSIVSSDCDQGAQSIIIWTTDTPMWLIVNP